MSIAKPIFLLNGEEIQSPIQRDELAIKLVFDGQVQPSIELQEFTFVNRAIEILDEWIANGKVFEGIPFQIILQNGSDQETVFDGYLDFREFVDFRGISRLVNSPTVSLKMAKVDGMDSIAESLQGLTFASLQDQGFLTNGDFTKVQYLVEKEFDFVEQAILGLSIYLMGKEIYEAAYRLADQIATIVSILNSSSTGAGAIGSFIYAVAAALFEAAYIALMLIAIIDLIDQFNENILPKSRKTNGVRMGFALEKIFESLGFPFSTSIPELNASTGWVYVPSKAEGREDSGFPSESDYGFFANEFVDLCIDMFKAQVFVYPVEGVPTVFLLNEDDPFFIKTSTYQMADVLDQPFSFNLDEANANLLIEFRSDPLDGYTLTNVKGTSYSVTTRPTNVSNPKYNLLKGLENIRINASLGTRKDKLSGLEQTFSAFWEAANAVIQLFGGDKENPVKGRVGFLKTTDRFFGPKILDIDQNGKIPKNHREKLSAKVLYQKYIKSVSFVENDFNRQRKKFNEIEIPFGWEDFKKVVNNSYFTTSDGENGKFEEIEWKFSQDKAKSNHWIKSVYATSLEEIPNEAE